MTFNEMCRDLRVTVYEREALAWHLAARRARETYEALRRMEREVRSRQDRKA
jgi:hypothetical protein